MPSQPNLWDAVTWAYRLMLGREPESTAVVAQQIGYLDTYTIEGVRRHFIASLEYKSLTGGATGEIKPSEPDFSFFHDETTYDREPGVFRDALGVRTRMSYLPAAYAAFAGLRAGDQGLQFLPFADPSEIAGMMEAARAARGTFTVLELGAGWGPWIGMGAAMARKTGVDYRLIAVEASQGHYDFLITHVADNKIDPFKCRLLHGIVGDNDGAAKFPKLLDPSLDYGASVDQTDAKGGYEEVQSFRIATLLEGEPIVDILHCDIQGHEAVALIDSIDAIDARVRRLIVGTHGRGIEEQLHKIFAEHGWSLSNDLACTFTGGTASTLATDGAQYWVNTRDL